MITRKAFFPTGTPHVGVFSPSSPISATVPARYERGKVYLNSRGVKVTDGALYGRRDGYRSGTAAERADEFNSLLYNEEIDILMASIGGNNTNAILPYIDYAYLKKHPKIIIGYSDATALLLAVHAKTGLVTFYGPALAASFGEFPPLVDATFESFRQIVLDKSLALPYTYPTPASWTDEKIPWDRQDRAKNEYPNKLITVRPGICRGRLIGGNLNTLEGFFGTPYMPEIQKGDILFLEDSLKDACTIERSFALLKLSGIYDRVGGIILGKHEGFDDNGTGRKPFEILTEFLGDRQIPVLAEFDCCHTHPMLTLPIGVEAELDAGKQQLTLLETPLCARNIFGSGF